MNIKDIPYVKALKPTNLIDETALENTKFTKKSINHITGILGVETIATFFSIKEDRQILHLNLQVIIDSNKNWYVVFYQIFKAMKNLNLKYTILIFPIEVEAFRNSSRMRLMFIDMIHQSFHNNLFRNDVFKSIDTYVFLIEYKNSQINKRSKIMCTNEYVG